MNFGQLASKMTPKGWAMAGGAAAAAIVFLVLIMNFASKPSYSTLMTGVDPTQTGKITSTLSTKGIGYQIQNNGTAIAVQSDKTGDARIALATAGLLNGTSQPGFELFDKQQLGASNFQQQITYQRALEGQLDQTIEGIQGVSSAQVQLVLPNPQDQLFSDSSQSSSAAVLLSNSATLDPNSVKGIAQLVASSVPGLQLNKVTITDSSGTPLWPNSDGSGADGTTLSQQAANQKYDSLTEAQVGAMLTQTLGPEQGRGPGQRDRGRQPGHLRHADVRQEGRGAADPDPERVAHGRRRHRRRGRHGRQHPRGGPDGRKRAAPTTRTRPTTPPSASTRPSPTR